MSKSPVGTGRVLGGRYKLGQRLARGGMAEVFVGRDELLGRAVAIKVLQPETAADQGLRRRFEIEGRSAARLSHPNVVAVYDVGEDDGVPYLIMEFVTGGSLADRIRVGPLPSADVVRFALEILAGLGAAHLAGILHRDVKPANVLISDQEIAKLADFGIAKSLQPSDLDATATAVVIGTPSYLAPERAAGAPAGVGSDLWAVGVVLYEALTGAKPFQGSTPLAIALAAGAGDYVPLPVRRSDVDPALAAAVHRSLNPDAASRYPSAAAMAMAIQGVEAEPGDAGWGAPAEAGPPATGRPVARGDQVGPTELLAPTAVESVEDRSKASRPRTVRLAAASAIVVAAGLLTWQLASRGNPTSPHTVPTTAIPSVVTTAVPTTQPTTPPTTPPTTRPPEPHPPHHKGGPGHGGPGRVGQA